MTRREFVTFYRDGECRCVCGNESCWEGHYPCTREGVRVEPTPEEWPEPLFVCDRCGRVWDERTGLVILNPKEAPCLK